MAEETKKKTVREKIVEISNELSLGRFGKNDFQGFKYFKPDDILRKINPLLQKNKLITVFDMPFNKEKEMYEGNLRIEDVITPDNGINYHFDIPLTQVKGAGQAQNAGATMTYCKRYMIMNAFNIADNAVDPDNEKNKPADSKSKVEEKKANLEETIAMIRATKDIETLNKWKEKIADSKIWNDVAKRSINSNIEEKLKELKTK